MPLPFARISYPLVQENLTVIAFQIFSASVIIIKFISTPCHIASLFEPFG